MWSVRFREENPDGTKSNKRLSGFATKRDAQQGYEKYIASKDKQKPKQPGDMTFAELHGKYMERQKTRTKESAYIDMESKIRSLILPAFSNKRMKDITPIYILEWYQELLSRYAFATVRWAYTYLSSIYLFGSRYYNIENVMVKVDRPRNTTVPKDKPYWRVEDLKKVLACLDDNPTMRMLIEFLFFTGCRKGEAFALNWDDINLVERTVHICKSLTVKTSEGGYKITTPKTPRSIRTIPIPQFLVDELVDYADWQQREGTGDAFVFGGSRHMPQASVDRWFHMATDEAGVEHIHIHDLRHSFVNNCLRQGVNIVAISHQLGHSNIETTFNDYSQWMPADDDAIREAQTALGELMSK